MEKEPMSLRALYAGRHEDEYKNNVRQAAEDGDPLAALLLIDDAFDEDKEN